MKTRIYGDFDSKVKFLRNSLTEELEVKSVENGVATICDNTGAAIRVQVDGDLEMTDANLDAIILDRAIEQLKIAVLGEIYDVVVKEDGKTIFVDSEDTKSSYHLNDNDIEKAIEALSQAIETYDKEILDEDANKIVYASAVTRMKFLNNNEDTRAHGYALLSRLRDPYYISSEPGGPIVTREGAARDMMSSILSDEIASRYIPFLYEKGSLSTFNERLNARIQGMIIINELYSKMETVIPGAEWHPGVSTNEKFKTIDKYWDKYMDKVIEDSHKIHDELSPDEIRRVVQARNMAGHAPRLYNEGEEPIPLTNASVSLAISNHFLDNLPVRYMDGVPQVNEDYYYLSASREEKELAISQKERNQSGLENNRDDDSDRDEYDNMSLEELLALESQADAEIAQADAEIEELKAKEERKRQEVLARVKEKIQISAQKTAERDRLLRERQERKPEQPGKDIEN